MASAQGRPARSRGRTILYTGILLILAFLIVEGAARLALGYLDTTWGLAVPPETGMLDPQLGWKLRPGVTAVSKRTGVPVEYEINSKGLRDDETPYEKPEGVFRIVVLGDSRTFGFGVREEQHFTRLLEGYIPGVEVINMGVDGYGVGQELLFLRTEGFKYEPDLVISYVAHFKDERHMHDKRWNMGKPVFVPAEDGSLELKNSPVTNNEAWYVAVRRIDRILSTSKAYTIFRDMVMHMSLALKRGGGDAQGGGAGTASHGLPWPDLAELPDSVGLVGPSVAHAYEGELEPEYTAEEILERAVAIIDQTRAESREHGAAYICMTQIYELIAACREKGINILDVRPVLSNELFKLPDNLSHINEAGQGALSWEMTRHLVHERFIHVEPPTEEDMRKSGGV